MPASPVSAPTISPGRSLSVRPASMRSVFMRAGGAVPGRTWRAARVASAARGRVSSTRARARQFARVDSDNARPARPARRCGRCGGCRCRRRWASRSSRPPPGLRRRARVPPRLWRPHVAAAVGKKNAPALRRVALCHVAVQGEGGKTEMIERGHDVGRCLAHVAEHHRGFRREFEQQAGQRGRLLRRFDLEDRWSIGARSPAPSTVTSAGCASTSSRWRGWRRGTWPRTTASGAFSASCRRFR